MTWSASAADLRRSAVPSLRKKPKVFLLRSALVFYAAEADQVIGRLVCARFRRVSPNTNSFNLDYAEGITRFHGVFAPNSLYRVTMTPAKRGK